MRIINTLTIFCFVMSAYSQVDTLDLLARAHADAAHMCAAFAKADYDSFLDLTHPKIVRMSGGRDALKTAFRRGLPDGTEIIETSVEPPKSLYVNGDTVQCALSQRQVMRMGGGRYSTLGYLLGLSYDAGRTWSFIGVAGRSLREIREQFSEVSEELNVWPQTRPLPLD